MLKKTKEYFKKRGFTSKDLYEMFEKYYTRNWSITKIAQTYGASPKRVKELVDFYTARRLRKRQRRRKQ